MEGRLVAGVMCGLVLLRSLFRPGAQVYEVCSVFLVDVFTSMIVVEMPSTLSR